MSTQSQRNFTEWSTNSENVCGQHANYVSYVIPQNKGVVLSNRETASTNLYTDCMSFMSMANARCQTAMVFSI